MCNSWTQDRTIAYTILLAIFSTSCILFSNANRIHYVSDERRLVNMLLRRYEQLGSIARPVANSSGTVRVQFGLRLVHLELDEKDQMMTTSVWVRMTWYDQLLTWNKGDFNNITHVVLPVDKIWTPEITLVNTAVTAVQEQAADISVRFDGRTFWAPQRKYSSACLINVTEFPYDRHTCDMWFQSISYPSKSLKLVKYYHTPLDMETYISSYKESQEWNILSNTTERHVVPRDAGMILMWSRRPALKFSLTVQRRPGFKGLLLIAPCALLSFMVPLVFCLPPERPDRHTLAMSLFASLTILLFMVTDVAPPTASFVPRLALYYCASLLILLFATVCSTLVINVSKRGEIRKRIPKTFRHIFFGCLGKALCFQEKIDHLVDIQNCSHSQQQTSGLDELPTDDAKKMLGFHECHQGGDLAVMNDLIDRLTTMDTRLNPSQIHSPTCAESDVKTPTLIRHEWRTLSLILDRFFCLLFIVLDILSLVMFLPR